MPKTLQLITSTTVIDDGASRKLELDPPISPIVFVAENGSHIHLPLKIATATALHIHSDSTRSPGAIVITSSVDAVLAWDDGTGTSGSSSVGLIAGIPFIISLSKTTATGISHSVRVSGTEVDILVIAYYQTSGAPATVWVEGLLA